MVEGQFVRHDGGLVMLVASVGNHGSFKAFNLKSTNLKLGEYKTKNTIIDKIPLKELQSLWKKMESKYTNNTHKQKVKDAITLLENMPIENEQSVSNNSGAKGTKAPYVNRPVAA